MAKLKCPKCKSPAVQIIPTNKVSAGKVAAGVMTGGLSLLATGVKSKKVQYHCTSCGHLWTI